MAKIMYLQPSFSVKIPITKPIFFFIIFHCDASSRCYPFFNYYLLLKKYALTKKNFQLNFFILCIKVNIASSLLLKQRSRIRTTKAKRDKNISLLMHLHICSERIAKIKSALYWVIFQKALCTRHKLVLLKANMHSKGKCFKISQQTKNLSI